MIRRLVIATHNAKKGGEMRTILSRRFPDLEILTLADYADAPEPEETGLTYAENASIKSESAVRVTGEWCIADDAGLEIDALGGEPGLYSKRFGGEETPFSEKMRRILELMRDVPQEKRTARFRCCVALSSPADTAEAAKVETRTFEATCEGRIAWEQRGSGGFGYDPIFFLPELGRNMAELTPDEKHAVSHRGKVLRMLADWLESAPGG